MTTDRASWSAPTPDWVTSGAEVVRGLDLLGLRAPAMRIGNSLLDGITTITPRVRYMSFLTWLTWLYWRRAGTDTRTAYLAFARRIEAAIALGNIAHDPSAVGLVGAEGSREALADPDGVPLDLKVVQLAANAYSVPAQQLGLLALRGDTQVPHLTDARGLPLAQTVDDVVRTTTLGRRLSDGELPERVPIDELREFGGAAQIRTFPEVERTALLDAIVPRSPDGAVERCRVASYGAFLARAAQGQERREYRALLRCAGQADRQLPAVFDEILDGWSLYLVRDLLAVAHEFALAALTAVLPRPGDGGPRWVAPADAVAKALGDPSMSALLRDLGLLGPAESWDTLTFDELRERVLGATSDGVITERGLRRWRRGLNEERLIAAVRTLRLGAPVALPVAWLLAERRAGPGAREHDAPFGALSPPREGLSRLGFEQVVLPALERFDRTQPRLPDVVAELLSWTVEQHLRTAWSRLAVDRRKDVARLLADGTTWAYRADFPAGQTDSRLSQLDHWLRQLGLLGDDGVTSEGHAVLDRCLAALAGGRA